MIALSRESDFRREFLETIECSAYGSEAFYGPQVALIYRNQNAKLLAPLRRWRL
jgi:hypothetical protein